MFDTTYLRCFNRVILFCLLGFISSNSTAGEFFHEKIRPSLVSIEINALTILGIPTVATGSGFVISDAGEVLTVYHLISELGNIIPETLKIGIKFEETSRIIGARLVSAEPLVDLMLLKIPRQRERYRPVELGNARWLESGLRVYTAYLSAKTGDYFRYQGYIRFMDKGNYRWDMDTRYLDTRASGAPVYSEDGVVIGIVTGRSEREAGIFTPIEAADPLLVSLRSEKIAEISSRLRRIEQRIDSVPSECRVCLRFANAENGSCTTSSSTCSGWSDAEDSEDDDGWTKGLQLGPGSPDLAGCLLQWKLECR